MKCCRNVVFVCFVMVVALCSVAAHAVGARQSAWTCPCGDPPCGAVPWQPVAPICADNPDCQCQYADTNVDVVCYPPPADFETVARQSCEEFCNCYFCGIADFSVDVGSGDSSCLCRAISGLGGCSW